LNLSRSHTTSSGLPSPPRAPPTCTQGCTWPHHDDLHLVDTFWGREITRASQSSTLEVVARACSPHMWCRYLVIIHMD
jgi:hypothetical protein